MRACLIPSSDLSGRQCLPAGLSRGSRPGSGTSASRSASAGRWRHRCPFHPLGWRRLWRWRLRRRILRRVLRIERRWRQHERCRESRAEPGSGPGRQWQLFVQHVEFVEWPARRQHHDDNHDHVDRRLRWQYRYRYRKFERWLVHLDVERRFVHVDVQWRILIVDHDGGRFDVDRSDLEHDQLGQRVELDGPGFFVDRPGFDVDRSGFDFDRPGLDIDRSGFDVQLDFDKLRQCDEFWQYQSEPESKPEPESVEHHVHIGQRFEQHELVHFGRCVEQHQFLDLWRRFDEQQHQFFDFRRYHVEHQQLDIVL